MTLEKALKSNHEPPHAPPISLENTHYANSKLSAHSATARTPTALSLPTALEGPTSSVLFPPKVVLW